MKTALVTGCSGLVGTFTIQKLLNSKKYIKIIGVDLKPFTLNFNDEIKNGFEFIKIDLTNESELINLFEKYDFDEVINCFGIKGSPVRAKTKPVDFLYPSFKINTEIINQCAKRNIYLVFMSSVGVYSPAEVFIEDDVWKTLPSENDWYPSWSKRMGELLLESYKIQYDYRKWSIIRPANIYGDYDDFGENSTVIASTIKKIYESSDTITCWGDGSPIRDFVYAGDVAEAIIQLVDNEINDIINFGSGENITIKYMVDELVKISGKNLIVVWDETKPNGDTKRQMDITKQKKYDLLPKTTFKEGLYKTYLHYTRNFKIEGLPFIVNEFLNTSYHVGNTNEIFEDRNEFLSYIDLFKNSAKEKKEIFSYRYEYRNTEKISVEYKKTIPYSEIPDRDRFIKDNNLQTVQKWGEITKYTDDITKCRKFLQNKIEHFMVKLYPELENNILHQDGFTIYENGDFIESHSDGHDSARKCVILVYLSDKKEYIDGGGKLIIAENDKIISVEPINTNYAILDFSRNNPNHAVEPVKNNFKRYTYIDFIYNKKQFENRKFL